MGKKDEIQNKNGKITISEWKQAAIIYQTY